MFLCRKCVPKYKDDSFLELFEIIYAISFGPCEECKEETECIDA